LDFFSFFSLKFRFDFYNDNATTIALLNQLLVSNNISMNIRLNSYANALKTVEETHTLLRASVASSQVLTFPQMKTLGFQIEKMLISCSFNDEQCYASNFTWYEHLIKFVPKRSKRNAGLEV
jgi:hypothetical protein